MADTKPDVCRVMVEQIWHIQGIYFRGWDKNVFVDDITDAIRNHTVVPEMVEFIERIAKLREFDVIRTKEAKVLLAKAEGRK